MNDDIKLQELFESYHPMLTDSNTFDQRLERKLAMIDEIRQMQADQIHRYRMAVLAAFLAGIVIGVGLLALILATPLESPLFTFGINYYPLLFFEQNSRLIFALLTALMIAFSIIAVLNTDDMVDRIKAKRI